MNPERPRNSSEVQEDFEASLAEARQLDQEGEAANNSPEAETKPL